MNKDTPIEELRLEKHTVKALLSLGMRTIQDVGKAYNTPSFREKINSLNYYSRVSIDNCLRTMRIEVVGPWKVSTFFVADSRQSIATALNMYLLEENGSRVVSVYVEPAGSSGLEVTALIKKDHDVNTRKIHSSRRYRRLGKHNAGKNACRRASSKGH